MGNGVNREKIYEKIVCNDTKKAKENYREFYSGTRLKYIPITFLKETKNFQ